MKNPESPKMQATGQIRKGHNQRGIQQNKRSLAKKNKLQGQIQGAGRRSKPQPRQIHIDDSKILGKGSGGTCVFQGKLHGRDVAVKRMLIQHAEVASLEIDFFQRVDLHPNILTYFHQERDKNFIYLAIEKCEGDLEQLIRLMKIFKDQGTIFP